MKYKFILFLLFSSLYQTNLYQTCLYGMQQNKKQFRYIGIKKDKTTYVMKVDAYFKLLKVDDSWSVVFKIVHPSNSDINELVKYISSLNGALAQVLLRKTIVEYLELEKTDIKIIIENC